MTASRDEIHRWLRACENEPWYRQQLGLTWKGLAEAIGISHFALRAARAGATVRKDRGQGGGYVPGQTVEMLAKIERVMLLIEGGRMVFRDGRAIELTTPLFVAPWPNPSLCADDYWVYWSSCQRCGGNKWSPIWLDGKPYVACVRCNPENGWPAWGASARQCRLTDRVLAELPVSDQTSKDLGLYHSDVELPKPPMRRGIRQRRAESSMS